MAKLVLKFRDNILREIPLADKIISIGRTEENDIVINNLGVSRQHARISKHEEDFILEDLSSSNGTLVNNKEVAHHTLNDKDEISIGKHSIIFFAHENIPSPINHVTTTIAKEPALSVEDTIKIAEFKTRLIKKDERHACIVPKVGVHILAGGVDQKIIYFQRILIVAGKGPTVDIRIQGNYDKDVVFIISCRPNGYFISPPKGIPILVNGKSIHDYVKLSNHDEISAAETVMQFFMEEN